MSVAHGALFAGLDALPFAILATVATVVFGRAGGLSATFVGSIAALVGVVALLLLGTISANRYRQNGRRFYFIRAAVVEGLFSLP